MAGRAGSACTLSRWLILEIPWETEPADATRVRSAPGAVCATAALGGRGMLQDAAVRRQCGSAQTEAGSSDVDESHLRALAISLQSYPRFVKGCGRSSYQQQARKLKKSYVHREARCSLGPVALLPVTGWGMKE